MSWHPRGLNDEPWKEPRLRGMLSDVGFYTKEIEVRYFTWIK
jgi:hypothetical protein